MDLFGPERKDTTRGWTELDETRRQYAALEKKINAGEYTSAEMEAFFTLRAKIIIREKEAMAKWKKHFGK